MKKRTAVKKSDPAAKRKRRRISRFHLVVTLFVAILVLGGATVFMLLFMPGSSSNDQPAVFAVKSVEVVGDTRYSREAIIGVSGIKVGQSVFSVDKRKASEKIREAFPYIDYIDIGNSSFDTVTIQVRETEVLGARYAEGYWYVVGGTSMAGGSGKIGGTIIGGLIIGVLNNGLNLLNVNSFWQYVVKGTVILLAVFVDYLRNKKAE